jgi:glycosyltransferase involved in cell wall biosynthesis
MKKILFIVPRFGSINRGVEIFVHELVSHIDKHQFEVTVLSGKHNLKIPGIYTIEKKMLQREYFDFLFKSRVIRKLLSFIHLDSSTSIESFSLAFSIRSFLKVNDFDLIIPSGGYWTFNDSFRYKKNAKIISIGHAGPVSNELCYSDVFVAVTKFAEQEVKEINKQIKVTQIDNGVNVARFFNKRKKTQRKRILCVAAFTQNKHYELLLDAFALLDKDITLMCVGKGPLEGRLKKHKTCSTHQVSFQAVSNEDMPNIYRNADVFTLPAPDECFGIVFLEALASGLNVVAHDGPRQRYVLGDVGLFCNVFDKFHYSETLKKALELEQYQQNIQHVKKYDWNYIASRYTELFLNVA